MVQQLETVWAPRVLSILLIVSALIFMAHGTLDPMIAIARARESRSALQALGYAVEWREYAMPHSVCAEEIADIAAWLLRTLAPAP